MNTGWGKQYKKGREPEEVEKKKKKKKLIKYRFAGFYSPAPWDMCVGLRRTKSNNSTTTPAATTATVCRLRRSVGGHRRKVGKTTQLGVLIKCTG